MADDQRRLLEPNGPTFAGRVKELLDDPELRVRMGEEGRIRADAFDIRRAVRRMEQVYEELLA